MEANDLASFTGEFCTHWHSVICLDPQDPLRRFSSLFFHGLNAYIEVC